MSPLHIIAAAATIVNTVIQVQALEGEGDGVPASRRQLPGLQHNAHVKTLNHVHCLCSPVQSHSDMSLGSLESRYKTLKCYGWVNKKYRVPRYPLKCKDI